MSKAPKAPKDDRLYGIGENADGTVNIFSPEKLKQKLAEIAALEKAATEPDEVLKELQGDES